MSPPTPPTVLLVDDEEFFLRSMADGFATLGGKVQVVTATNGKAALRVLASRPVDLVVTDLKMPEMDGFELVAELSRTRPGLPVITMTAFGTPEMEDRLRASGITTYLDKPIDFQTLSARVLEALSASTSGHLRGIALATFLQMIELDRKSCTVGVLSEGRKGTLWFNHGQLMDAAYGALKGQDAAMEILTWDDAGLDLAPAGVVGPRRIALPLSELLLEAFRLRDEQNRKRPGAARPPEPATLEDALSEPLSGPPEVSSPPKEAVPMAALDKLKELAAIDGFSGAAVFTPTGEVLASVTGDVANLKDVGVLANAVLLNAQKSSLEMGSGRGQQVHIEAEKSQILVRCLNEGTDPLKSQPGKAHLHLVCILKNDASIGLAKMRVNSVIEKLAEDFRF